jgi:hypothetical protein
VARHRKKMKKELAGKVKSWRIQRKVAGLLLACLKMSKRDNRVACHKRTSREKERKAKNRKSQRKVVELRRAKKRMNKRDLILPIRELAALAAAVRLAQGIVVTKSRVNSCSGTR